MQPGERPPAFDALGIGVRAGAGRHGSQVVRSVTPADLCFFFSVLKSVLVARLDPLLGLHARRRLFYGLAQMFECGNSAWMMMSYQSHSHIMQQQLCLQCSIFFTEKKYARSRNGLHII